MNQPPSKDEVEHRIADLPPQLANALKKCCKGVPPDYLAFKAEVDELLRPIREYSEYHFHRGQADDCFFRAIRTIVAEKWRIYLQIKSMLSAPDGQHSLETINKFKLLTSFCQPIEIFDLEYQLEHEQDETRLPKLLEDFAYLLDGMGTTAFFRAQTAFNSGNLNDAMAHINRAIEKTPDTPQYRLLKADVLRAMASIEEHGALDDSPDHPAVRTAVQLSTDIDELRDQLERQGITVHEFLEHAEARLEKAIEAGEENPHQWDKVITSTLGLLRGLSAETVQFLRTGEYLRSRSTTWQDHSPVAIEFSKAAERELLLRVFHPFRDAQAPSAAQQSFGRAAPLERFVTGGRDLTLGEMGFLLCRATSTANNRAAYESELRRHVISSVGEEKLKGMVKLIDRDLVNRHRNAAAHPEPMSKAAAEAARDWAYDILRLLVLQAGENGGVSKDLR